MRSSRPSRKAALCAGLAFAFAFGWASRADAQQQQPQGFALERFYPAAPGGGWMVTDDLDMRGGLGGAVAVSSGYAHDPLRVTDGVQHLDVVADQASFDVALAVTYDRFRLYLNLDSPIVGKGAPGTVGANVYRTSTPSAPGNVPSFDISTHPDTIADARVGFDARLIGDPKGPFRLGAGAQLYVPSGNGSDYLSDGTYRAMLRVLAAGNVGLFTYAGQLGVHIRPLDESPAPGAPQGSELLFGIAGGPRFPVDSRGETVVIVGPEVYGESALKSLLGTTSTGVEGLLTGRIEGAGDDGRQVQLKLGVGGGLNPHFGAPEWRFVFALSLFDHSVDTDGDGVTDSKDACPHAIGVKTADPKRNGCPLDRDADGVPDAQDACPDNAGTATTDPRTTGCGSTGASPVDGD
jgi:OOP family OmpA-OmpF porin